MQHEHNTNGRPQPEGSTLAAPTAQDLALQILAQLLGTLATAAGSLTPNNRPNPTGPPADPLITLDAAAASVARSKRSLEHYKKRMPAPEVVGVRGEPSLWRWSALRPWLERQFRVSLSESGPVANRFGHIPRGLAGPPLEPPPLEPPALATDNVDPDQLAEDILDALRSGPARTAEALAARAGYQAAEVELALVALCRRGLVERTANGFVMANSEQ